ncbi:T-cell receptor-associated transmembrane adapter 1 [Trichechus manatus latirostris]|uniref:T-cell receptor-associated transmembrane adapter 1 n=1 Tax=Trichechus manatus latirostris TaxID=127582 RepID=UPI000CA04F0F|nr:T-cell receptor-associated transmembrane adapter 1 [Trichechus manatus latirostris]
MSGNVGCHFLVWGLIAFLGLALVISLIFNISHYVEKQRQDKVYGYSDDYIPRDDEYFLEDIPIYGNLDDVVSEPTDENCYEQMKARPERSVNKRQEVAPPAQAATEPQVCYGALNHSCKAKLRKPRKQDVPVSHKDEDEQLRALDASISKTTLLDSLPPGGQEVEENIHDDPVRLFGLIRAKKDPIN